MGPVIRKIMSGAAMLLVLLAATNSIAQKQIPKAKTLQLATQIAKQAAPYAVKELVRQASFATLSEQFGLNETQNWPDWQLKITASKQKTINKNQRPTWRYEILGPKQARITGQVWLQSDPKLANKDKTYAMTVSAAYPVMRNGRLRPARIENEFSSMSAGMYFIDGEWKWRPNKLKERAVQQAKNQAQDQNL